MPQRFNTSSKVITFILSRHDTEIGYHSYQGFTGAQLGLFVPYLLESPDGNHSRATAQHNGSIIIQSLIFGNTTLPLTSPDRSGVLDLCVIFHSLTARLAANYV